MAVLTSYIPTNNSTKRILKYFVCDTYAELPTTFSIGDMATAEGKMYYAANVGMSLSWIELIAKPNNYALGSLVRNNTGTSNILTNQAVSINNNGVQPAFSSNSTNNIASGIALGNMSIGNPGIIVTNGYIESSNWSSATGSMSLTPNARYFLSTTPGMFSTNPPSSTINQVVGRAITSNILLLSSFDYIEVS